MLNTLLVIVNHPKIGDSENAISICGEIRKKLAGVAGTVCFFHDASSMENACIGYAENFRKLDRELAERTRIVICAIPNLVPRVMARTVSSVSTRKWDILRSKEEAVKHLAQIGIALSNVVLPASGAVSIVSVGGLNNIPQQKTA